MCRPTRPQTNHAEADPAETENPEVHRAEAARTDHSGGQAVHPGVDPAGRGGDVAVLVGLAAR